MLIFGVVNCSPDSLNTDSFVADGPAAERRIDRLLADGADGIDIGGQGSTEVAELSDAATEWARVEPALLAAVACGVDVSIDTFRTEIADRALSLGANTINAANGMQDDRFWELAAEHGADVVVPFINGPNPFELTHVVGDPIDRMLEYFEDRLVVAHRFGVEKRCLLDPGTGFGPHGWAWEDRYVYQKHVYANLHRLRTLDLPLYIPLPWRTTPQHEELLELALSQRPEFGRVHYPAHVREVERRVSAAQH